MMDNTKPDVVEGHSVPPKDRDKDTWFTYLLAAFWIILPAVQYAGAYQRTVAVTVRDANMGALGMADLLPWDIVLVGATALYVLKRMARQRNLPKNGDGKQE